MCICAQEHYFQSPTEEEDLWIYAETTCISCRRKKNTISFNLVLGFGFCNSGFLLFYIYGDFLGTCNQECKEGKTRIMSQLLECFF